MVNLEWYRSFVEVYRMGTVSGAAEVLHLTQPAVSQHIAALESTLGTALFQRMPRQMLPTEAGKRLYTRVVVAIETLEAIPTKATLANAPVMIRLGTPTEFFSEYVLERLPKESETLLVIKFGLMQELIEQLLANQIDCAIATQKIAKPELEYQLIFEESFWLVGSPTATNSGAEDPMQVDLTALEQWLRAQPWIAYSEDLPIIRRFWRVIFGRRLDVNPQLIMPDLRSIREAIAQGLGFSVLPDYLCAEWIADRRLTLILKPAQPVTNSIWLVYRKSERQSQQITLLLNWLGVKRMF
ncbi:MAG: LysR family transcriptional regulator [Leptolyngbyaceae cyanobacterium CSU_1_3]|nr:LysR family transcriptional regulator [Leptolyngbyaceae cyanobacterium CSU_1_3]